MIPVPCKYNCKNVHNDSTSSKNTQNRRHKATDTVITFARHVNADFLACLVSRKDFISVYKWAHYPHYNQTENWQHWHQPIVSHSNCFSQWDSACLKCLQPCNSRTSRWSLSSFRWNALRIFSSRLSSTLLWRRDWMNAFRISGTKMPDKMEMSWAGYKEKKTKTTLHTAHR